MCDKYVPSDLLLLPESFSQDTSSSSKLPSRPKSRPEKWDQAKSVAIADIDNWRKWDLFFKVLEDSWASSGSKEAAAAAHTAVESAFSVFLRRFPYSAGHWRQFSLLQYKMVGVEASVDVLKKSVVECPQNVALWVDYLSALMTVELPVESAEKQGKTAGKEAAEKKELEKEDETDQGASSSAPVPASSPNLSHTEKNAKNDFIRAEFRRAADQVGWNFNSDAFWNKYIEFETSSAGSSASSLLLKVYLRLIRIPLYQYAQYYNQFTEINKNFAVSEIIGEAELPKYLAALGKGSSEELSVVEQHQIIDTFSYDIFTQTQAHVSRIWPFEAAVTLQDYTLYEAELVSKQTADWIAYLDSEIALLDTLESGPVKQLQYDLIKSLFERALVPNCAHSGLWHKYVDFTKNHSVFPVEMLVDIYKRAIFKFLPLKEHNIREDFANVLKKEKGFDAANAFLFDTLRLYSGTAGSRIYVKTAYVHELTQICELWRSSVPKKETLPVLESLLSGYFDRTDRYKKENGAKKAQYGKPENGSKDGSKSAAELKPSYSVTVSKFLNNDGICVVAVQYLKLLESDPEDTETIRKFYDRYHTEQAFSRSVQFWKFFVEFEGYGHKNLTNLRSIVTYIKTTTALPKMAIDAFLDIYYDITCANLAQAMALSGKENYLDILINIHAEKSDDLSVNTSARTRLAKNNYLLETKPGQTSSKEDALMKMRAKHMAHPGVFVEARPEITNTLMDQGWISLLDDKIEPPALPRFRNMDKAHVPVHYPEE